MMVQFVRVACWLGERLAHPRRDGSLKIKLDACRRRMERLVRRSHSVRCGNYAQGLACLGRLKMPGFIDEALATRIGIPSCFDS
jgi:hypothetical protein